MRNVLDRNNPATAQATQRFRFPVARSFRCYTGQYSKVAVLHDIMDFGSARSRADTGNPNPLGTNITRP